MVFPPSRRRFLAASSAAIASPLLTAAPSSADEPNRSRDNSTINVVVWDEQQPAQKEAYDNFLGNAIADHLRTQPEFSVKSVKLDDPEHGLAADVLGPCNVLIWWGHVRQAEISPEVGKAIVARIKAGTLSLIALHSAHWSTPFVEAMNERTRIDLRRDSEARSEVPTEVEVAPPRRYTVPAADARVTPWTSIRKFPGGTSKATVYLPLCCFPAYRNDGKPSHVQTLKPGHPIAEGIPAKFELSRTEMYDEPFHVPDPDEVLFEERWAGGEWFRSGMLWTLGKGRVFYFRPGHETYPIYRNPIPLKILANAARWLGTRPG
ncbi:ThuA domain-containing protein [Singulisphaera rosea]